MGFDIQFIDGCDAYPLFPYRMTGIYDGLARYGMLPDWPESEPPDEWPDYPVHDDFGLVDLEQDYDPWVDAVTVDALDQRLLPDDTPENVRAFVAARIERALWTPKEPTGLQSFKAYLQHDCAFAPREIRAALAAFPGDCEDEPTDHLRAFIAVLGVATEHGGLRLMF